MKKITLIILSILFLLIIVKHKIGIGQNKLGVPNMMEEELQHLTMEISFVLVTFEEHVIFKRILCMRTVLMIFF